MGIADVEILRYIMISGEGHINVLVATYVEWAKTHLLLRFADAAPQPGTKLNNGFRRITHIVKVYSFLPDHCVPSYYVFIELKPALTACEGLGLGR